MSDRRFSFSQALRIYKNVLNKRSGEQRRNMAWQCGGSTNEELVNNLYNARIFSSERVREAMLAVDRGDFASYMPYNDSPQGIGYQATISAPHMHASALEYLKDHLVSGARVLDVGSGSGYLSVCMAMMIGVNGKVIGIEHIPELVRLSNNNTNKHHRNLLQTERLQYVEGDGRKGYAQGGPYDAIHVGAAAETIPKALIDQLAEGGRMLIPVGRENDGQVFLQVDKINGQTTENVIEHVIYVPLTSKEHQLEKEF
ncbi:unnamed protein product [Auanema sp. JU1783]|nr:unnamed protein product [Auanema sp. JU1783]